jgi:uncharacterized OsmC-like protein
MKMKDQIVQQINGIDTEFLRESIEQISADPAKGMTNWKVTNFWKGGTRSDAQVKGYTIGGEYVPKDYTIKLDEPLEIGGTNQFANPQEYLLAAFNACIMVGYVAVSALEGVELEELRIETEGDIDLRGFLGIDPDVAPGYESLTYTVYIKGNGTPEQFQKIHEFVTATAPNRYNLGHAIKLNTRFEIG